MLATFLTWTRTIIVFVPALWSLLVAWATGGVESKVRANLSVSRGGGARGGTNAWTRADNGVAFVDGSVTHDGAAGVGVWYGRGHSLNFAAALPAGTEDNNVAELCAVFLALVRHPRRARLTIYTDSRACMSTLESLAAGTSVDEFRPFSPAHRALLRAMRWVLFWREARTIVHKVKGHSGQTSNDRADQLAALGANSDIVATVPGYGGERTTSNAPTNQLPNVASSHGFFPGSLRYDLTRFLEGVAAEGSGAISNDLHAFTRKETAEGCRSNDRFASHRGPLRIPTPIDDSFEVTGALALDCEMVGSGPNGEKSILAQVSVVNESGNVVYSSFVAPTKAVTDYRTHVSGITPDNIDDAPSFSFVQSEVRELIRGKIIVGHALENDFDVLKLRHPPGLVRDTAHWRPFLRAGRFSKRLRHLARDHCGLIIQGGSHDPAEDARAAMYLYLKFRDNWEGRVDVMQKGRDSRGRLTHY